VNAQRPIDDLDAYLDLSAEEIARLVLCLIVEDMLRERLLGFRQYLPAQPVQRLEKLGV
jgi:hypothetical protein